MSKENNFDSIRLLAALTVMVSHAFALSGRVEPRPYAGLTLGTYAVFAFFAISGYLVSTSWRNDPNVRRFLARRMLRIAPAYIVVVALAEAFMRALGLATFEMNPLPWVNGSLWTITLEIQCYMLFMALAVFTRHGSLAMIAATLYLGKDTYFEMFAGLFALAALISEYELLRRRAATLSFVSIGLIMILWDQLYYGIALVMVPVVIAAGCASWPGLRATGRRGDFSYGIYLYAFPVQQIVIMLLGPQQSLLLLLALTFAATFVCAWLSWHYIEKPMLALKPKREADVTTPLAKPKEPTRLPSQAVQERSIAQQQHL